MKYPPTVDDYVYPDLLDKIGIWTFRVIQLAALCALGCLGVLFWIMTP